MHSGLAGPWNRGIIAHQTPHFRRPPKHVNNKGPLVFAQTFCTAWFISLENLYIYSKTYVFSNTFEGFRPKCTFRGCLRKYRRTFVVYMFRRPPEVWSLMSDNALISGTGKVGIEIISARNLASNCLELDLGFQCCFQSWFMQVRYVISTTVVHHLKHQYHK